MPSMPSPIRLAFVAALAAFALGACSGGGGKPTTMAGTMTPAPSPSTPTAGDRTDFFPIAAEHLAMTVVGDERTYIPTGTTLSSLPGEAYTSRNHPQFSVFEFGAVTNANGIPLQKSPTKTSAGRYAAVAYQAVLEHSMFLFQGGVYNFAVDGVTAGRPSGAYLSTGVPTTGSPIAGTWKGKAVGLEWAVSPTGRPTLAVNAGQAERPIVQADVEIGVSLDGTDQNVTWAFTDWTGGSIDYPDYTSEGTLLLTESQGSPPHVSDGDHYLVYRDQGGSPLNVSIRFYGPDRQEAGGTFRFQRRVENPTIQYTLEGVYAAKKQP